VNKENTASKGSEMTDLKLPSGEQLYAYERLARRERARMQAEIVKAAYSALKQRAAAFLGGAKRPVTGKAVLHG
jgi:hypothetical protein